MIEPRQRGAKTLGQAVPYYAPQPSVAPRYCERCGCRISRYAEYTATLCAPCDSVANPWMPSEPMPSRRAWYWHAHKAAGSKSCLECHLEMIGADHPTWYGTRCACGGPKTCGARMCRHCRYPKGAM